MRRLFGASAEALIIVILVFGLLAVPVLAAKGGGGNGGGGGGKPGGGGTITLAMVDDVNGNGAPNYADSVTFVVSTTATDQPLVSLRCYQAGSMVYSASTAYYEGYPWPWTQIMTLSSYSWTSGAADCTAELYMHDGRRFKTLATTAFGVQE